MACDPCGIALEFPDDWSESTVEFFEEVISTLGGNLVDVELCPSDLMNCFKKAKRTFIQKGHNSYRREFMVLDVDKNTTVYNLPDVVDTVVKIVKPGSGWQLEDAFSMVAYNELFSDILSGGGCCNRGGIDFLSYEFTLDRIERMRRIAAYEIQFHHDKFRKTLTFLKRPEVNTKWLVECYTNLTDDEYRQIDWILRWTVAEAKHMLGMAYRKFSSLPGPTGETSLSGSEYIQEAKEEKEQLLEDILNFVDGESDYMEIRFG